MTDPLLARPSLRRRLAPIPSRATRHLGPRLVLATGCLLGLVALGVFAVARSDLVAINFRTYRLAAGAAVAGEPFYAVHPPGRPAYTFLYPPVTVLAWVPSVALPVLVGYALQTGISIVCGVAIGLLSARVVEAAGVDVGTLDRALLAAFAAGSVHAVPTLAYGNVNLVLALALFGGLLALERRRSVGAGVAFALPALVKVFPALVGLWLLRRRAWRAIVVATATGFGVLVAGTLAFGPDATTAWIRAARARGDYVSLLSGGLPPDAAYVTALQPLSLVPVPTTWLPALAALCLAPFVLYCYADVSTRRDRLVAVHATLAVALLVVPAYYVHLVFLYPTLLPLLYVLEAPAARYPFLAGGFLTTVAVTPVDLRAYAPSAVEWLLPAVEPVMTVATPPLLGVVLTLVGCVGYTRLQRRRAADLD